VPEWAFNSPEGDSILIGSTLALRYLVCINSHWINSGSQGYVKHFEAPPALKREREIERERGRERERERKREKERERV
jgi:hypothetical protein